MTDFAIVSGIVIAAWLAILGIPFVIATVEYRIKYSNWPWED